MLKKRKKIETFVYQVTANKRKKEPKLLTELINESWRIDPEFTYLATFLPENVEDLPVEVEGSSQCHEDNIGWDYKFSFLISLFTDLYKIIV